MTCEGLGDWRGQATWLVHFQQREDRVNHMQSYLVANLTDVAGLSERYSNQF
jgi:hypothetical protein